jgi:hypothetical protein
MPSTAENSDRKCEGCGAPLPHAHPRRIWCSERCRKQTRYSRPCVDCGKPLNGSNGHGPKAPLRCTVCAPRAAVPAAIREREDAVIRMRGEGMRNTEIAAALGDSVSAIASLVAHMRRDRGRVVPDVALGRPPHWRVAA